MTKLSYTRELLEAGVIDTSTAERIDAYFASRSSQKPNLLLLIFGVLGACLIGMGILLIVAHNWDQFPKGIKTLLAFLPMVVGQFLCYYTLKKKSDSRTWRESSAVYLTLSIPACLSITSQIYQLQGDFASFLFVCLLLALPIIYVMNASATSLVYWLGSIILAFASYDNAYDVSGLYRYLLVIVLVLPFTVHLFQKFSDRNTSILHSWLVPVSLLAGLNLSVINAPTFLPLFFISLLAILYMIGYLETMKKKEVFKSGFVVIGSAGTVIALLIFTYYDFWKSVEAHVFEWDQSTIQSLISTAILYLAAILLFLYHKKKKSFDKSAPVKWVFIFFAAIYTLGCFHAFTATLLTNFLLLGMGILTVLAGIKRNHLGILNYGLIIITALIFLRFIDINISFILRGLMNIGVGLAFFFANYYWIKKRKVS